ncbi:MAG: hypothetical protein LAO03_09515 [Acidobacteriia bacterium]|nr:hypothetical protein [Terriglobia bacterium]
MRKELRRGLVMSLIAAAMGFSAFLRMQGSENVRAVQIVSLLATGIGLGVALSHARVLWGLRKEDKEA